jgi:hypothetical protein
MNLFILYWWKVRPCVCSHNVDALIIFSFPLSLGLEWKRVHYYCGHMLACCTKPGWEMVTIEEQLVEVMGGKRTRYPRRKPASVSLCLPQIPNILTGIEPGLRGGKPATSSWIHEAGTADGTALPIPWCCSSLTRWGSANCRDVCAVCCVRCNNNNSIQFNSILYYLCAESTATRPITDTAQYR